MRLKQIKLLLLMPRLFGYQEEGKRISLDVSGTVVCACQSRWDCRARGRGDAISERHVFPEGCCFSLEGAHLSLSSRLFPERVITLSPLTAKMPPKRKGTSPGGHRGFLQHNQEEGLASSTIRKAICLLPIYQCLNSFCSQVLCSTFVFRDAG